jgi:ribosomal protein S18 acetylase RimI-like enzyme
MLLRDYDAQDAPAVNALVQRAFASLEPHIPDWPGFSKGLGALVDLADHSHIILAEGDGQLMGVVGYVGPGQSKKSFFKPEWPIVRLLSVAPEHQGHGVGRALVEECIRRARADGASLIALHTSHVMRDALELYASLGFEWVSELPPMYGMSYGLYAKKLASSLHG